MWATGLAGPARRRCRFSALSVAVDEVTVVAAGVLGAWMTSYRPLSGRHPEFRIAEICLGAVLLAWAIGLVAFDVAAGFLG